jgi:hypothetical protein
VEQRLGNVAGLRKEGERHPLPERRVGFAQKAPVAFFPLAMAGLLCVLSGLVGRAQGEVFVLQNGGKVVGEVVEQDPPDKENVTIKTTAGATVTLSRSQIKQTLHLRPEELEYEKLRAKAADTVEGQWDLSEWCRENRLTQQRETHLKRVVELDPNHEKARAALGYQRSGDTWTTQEETMLKQGYRRYKGRWRTAQEIELLEQKRKTELSEKEWMQKVGTWRSWLGTDRSQAAHDNLVAIADPMAIKALAEVLKNDPRDEARRIYIESLAHIGNSAAMKVLALWAMEEQVDDISLACIDVLKKHKSADATAYFVTKLRSKSNPEVNKAGRALLAMGDPSAVGPLIDALVTVHKFKVVQGNPGQMSATFGGGSGGGGSPGGLSVGGGPKFVTEAIPNGAVRDALTSLTGVDYAFDVGRWQAWYTVQKEKSTVISRRGE